MENSTAVIEKILAERRADEIKFHRDRMNRFLQEKFELEIRLTILNDLIKQMMEYEEKNPLFKQ